MTKKTFILLILAALLLTATALPAFASDFSHPIHGRDDLSLHPFKNPAYGHHPHGCQAPLVLNRHGMCALPGMQTRSDQRFHRRGF